MSPTLDLRFHARFALAKSTDIRLGSDFCTYNRVLGYFWNDCNQMVGAEVIFLQLHLLLIVVQRASVRVDGRVIGKQSSEFMV